ncbi:MAG: hypothetical protein ACRDTV_12225, partial [Mycobacterium sp.]
MTAVADTHLRDITFITLLVATQMMTGLRSDATTGIVAREMRNFARRNNAKVRETTCGYAAGVDGINTARSPNGSMDRNPPKAPALEDAPGLDTLPDTTFLPSATGLVSFVQIQVSNRRTTRGGNRPI